MRVAVVQPRAVDGQCRRTGMWSVPQRRIKARTNRPDRLVHRESARGRNMLAHHGRVLALI